MTTLNTSIASHKEASDKLLVASQSEKISRDDSHEIYKKAITSAKRANSVTLLANMSDVAAQFVIECDLQESIESKLHTQQKDKSKMICLIETLANKNKALLTEHVIAQFVAEMIRHDYKSVAFRKYRIERLDKQLMKDVRQCKMCFDVLHVMQMCDFHEDDKTRDVKLKDKRIVFNTESKAFKALVALYA